jgi:hypothetical protein
LDAVEEGVRTRYYDRIQRNFNLETTVEPVRLMSGVDSVDVVDLEDITQWVKRSQVHFVQEVHCVHRLAMLA